MTQLPLIRVGLVERITVRLLSALLGPANAIAPILDEWEKMRFYAIKNRILIRYADTESVMDIQRIVLECRRCYGCGIGPVNRRTHQSDTCYRCSGTGVYRTDYFGLARYNLAGRVFHRPVRRWSELPADTAVTIEGRVSHKHPGPSGWESLLWMALLFDRRLFCEAMIRSDAPRQWTWRPMTNLHQNAQAWIGRWRWVLAHLPHRCCVCKRWLPPSLYCCDACLPF